MRVILMMAQLLILVGCASASLVQSVYEPNKGGVVKYKNGAISGEASKEKAHTIMANYCAPTSYKIIEERASTETVGYQSNTTGNMNGNSFGNSYSGSYNSSTQVTPVNRSYTYAQFRCEAERGTASVLGH